MRGDALTATRVWSHACDVCCCTIDVPDGDVCPSCGASEPPCAYEQGRIDERAAVVAWLRGGGLSAGRTSPDDPYVEAVAMVAADAIERGEHRRSK